MPRFISKIRAWWAPGPALTPEVVPCEVACVCGTVAKGAREKHHQILTCAGCGGKVFVLPISPFEIASGTAAVVPIQSRALSFWRWPLVAASLTLTALALVLLYALNKGLNSPHEDLTNPAGQLARHIETGKRALTSGKFSLAANEFKTVQHIRQQHPETALPCEPNELTQLQRQALLLAELISDPLEEVLRQAADMTRLDEREWHAAFAQRYQNKSVVFDADVQQTATGKYLLDYAVFFRGKPATLDLGKPSQFEPVPFDGPRRLLFGIRLGEIIPDAEGTWIIRFDPNSAVLLTDVGAAAIACGQPAEDLRDAVRRQADWLAR